MYTFSSMKKMKGKNIQNRIFKNSIQIQHGHPVLTYIHTYLQIEVFGIQDFKFPFNLDK